MRKVLLGVPAYDGRVDVWFANSLVNTIRLSYEKQVAIVPVYMAYDSLVQRARNDIVRLAIEDDFDDLIFVDSDIEWHPDWLFKLLDYDVDVVGGLYPKKSDTEQYPVHALDTGMFVEPNGLIEMQGLPTGFLRISKSALKQVWDASAEYMNEGRKCRMVFDIAIQDGLLVSEDIIFCRKWRSLGGKVWLDPVMCCNHIGIKKYTGNFIEYIKDK